MIKNLSNQHDSDSKYIRKKPQIGSMQKSSSKTIVKCSLDVSADRDYFMVKQKNGKLAIFELLSTEKAYILSLREIKEGYIDFLSQSSSFQTKSLKNVFKAWTSLMVFHQNFSKELEESSNRIQDLARVFINHEENFKAHYLDICLHYSNALDDLTQIQSKEALEMMSTCQKKLGHPLPLTSYLLKPIQRILKYQMLLRVIEKSFTMGLLLSTRAGGENTSCSLDEVDEMMADQVQLHKALQTMICVADFINEKKRMFELMEHLRSLDLDVNSWGDLVKMNTFRMPRKSNRRLILLFTNTLVVCKGTFDPSTKTGDMGQTSNHQATSSTLSVIEIRQFKKMMLIEFQPKDPCVFHIVHHETFKEQHQLTFIADTFEMKHQWCIRIKQSILDHYSVKIPEHARQLVLSMSTTAAPLQEKNPTKRSSSSSTCPKAKRKNSLNHGRLARILPQLNGGNNHSSLTASPTMVNVISEPLDENGNPVHYFNGCLMISQVSPNNRQGNLPNDPVVRKSSPIRRPNAGIAMANRNHGQNDSHLEDLTKMDFRCITIEINEERARNSSGTIGGGEVSPQVRFRDNSQTESLINKRQHRLSISNKLMTALFNENNPNSSSLIDFHDNQTSNCSSLLLSNEKNTFFSSSPSSMSNRNSSISSMGPFNGLHCYDRLIDNEEFETEKSAHLLLSEREIDQILDRPVDNTIGSTKRLITREEDERQFSELTEKIFANLMDNCSDDMSDVTNDNNNLLRRSHSQIDRSFKFCNKNQVIESSFPWQKQSILPSFSQISLHEVGQEGRKKKNTSNLMEAIPYVDDSEELSMGSSNELSEDSAYHTKRTSSVQYSLSNQELNAVVNGVSDLKGRIEGCDMSNYQSVSRNQNKFKTFFDRLTSNSLTKIL